MISMDQDKYTKFVSKNVEETGQTKDKEKSEKLPESRESAY